MCNFVDYVPAQDREKKRGQNHTRGMYKFTFPLDNGHEGEDFDFYQTMLV